MRNALAVALMWAGVGFAPQAEVLTARCTGVPGKAIKIEGTAPFPDGTILSLQLFRIEEVDVVRPNGKIGLVSAPGEGLPGMVKVDGKKFLWKSEQHRGPAPYLLHIQKAILDVNAAQVEPWKIEIAAWDEKLMEKFGDGFLEADGLIRDARGHVMRFSAACASEALLKAQGPTLTKQLDDFIKKFELLRAKSIYTASLLQASGVISSLRGNSQAFIFEGGKFMAKDYYGVKEDPRGQAFSFAQLLKYLDDAETLAGREFILWILKDFRIRKGDVRKLVSEVKKQEKVASVKPYADQLAKLAELKTEELDQLEKTLRGEE